MPRRTAFEGAPRTGIQLMPQQGIRDQDAEVERPPMAVDVP
ncbi:hypothetical protein ACFV27_25930 [Streptomyces antimycoticus]